MDYIDWKALSAARRRDEGIHHPPPQAGARTFVQEAGTVGRQVDCGLCAEGDGDTGRATRPKVEPGGVVSGYQVCAPQDAAKA